MSRSLSAEVLASRYRLDALIASGGMGAVWRAVDLVLDRPVAVKLLRAELAQHADTVARFRAEARHAAGLSHPSIAQVYDFGEAAADQPAFLVLELVDGPPLTELIATGQLPPDQVMDIVAQVASGLAVAHAAGVVHRDIKPANLLLDGSGIVKITDFGVAHAAGSAPLTRTGTLIGTPAYLAPERIAGQAAGPASDLYSLGMVAYECLAGAVPFTGTAMEIALAHRMQGLPPLPASVPARVAGLITDLTAKDPGGRPAGAAEVAARARALRDDIRAGAIGPGTGLAGDAAGSGSPDVTAELPVAAAWQLAEPGEYGPAGGAADTARPEEQADTTSQRDPDTACHPGRDGCAAGLAVAGAGSRSSRRPSRSPPAWRAGCWSAWQARHRRRRSRPGRTPAGTHAPPSRSTRPHWSDSRSAPSYASCATAACGSRSPGSPPGTPGRERCSRCGLPARC